MSCKRPPKPKATHPWKKFQLKEIKDQISKNRRNQRAEKFQVFARNMGKSVNSQGNERHSLVHAFKYAEKKGVLH